MTESNNCVNFNVMRVKCSCERLGINAAMVEAICKYYSKKLSAFNGFYICDGSRNIFHKTAFQDYLEKYFGFRKAYCKLRLIYKTPLKIIVKLLMPIRKLLYKLDNFSIICKINGILRMEEISRSQI